MAKQTLNALRLGALVGLASVTAAACGSGLSRSAPAATIQATQPVDDQLAGKAEGNCWFKVKNRSSRSEEVRLWTHVSSTGARTERLGQLLVVTGAMDPAVRDARYYGCSLYEYTSGSPVVMTATTASVPVRADSVIPYGFSRDGRKQLQ